MAALCGVILWLAGCAASPATLLPSPDEQFGHRYEGVVNGRRTVTITPADPGREFLYYPAYVESLHVRQGAFDSTSTGEVRAPVELLLKGSFSDDCTELHAVEQHRTGHIMELDLLIRKPRGVECLRVERPFRFYLPLDGLYPPGDYTLKLGENLFAFQVEAPPTVQAGR